jgi:CubicO group peptidase (beta-lactamase class C family)
VFGELVKRRMKQDPLEYLTERVLEPIGLQVARWRRDKAGNPEMASGAFLTAREWAKFGELVRDRGMFRGQRVISERALRGCFRGSRTNPAYGQTFWNNRPVRLDLALATAEDERARRRLQRLADSQGRVQISAAAPADLIMAAGAGKQRLYVIPSLELVIVRQGESDGKFSDDEFLQRLLKGVGGNESRDQTGPDAAGEPSSQPGGESE